MDVRSKVPIYFPLRVWWIWKQQTDPEQTEALPQYSHRLTIEQSKYRDTRWGSPVSDSPRAISTNLKDPRICQPHNWLILTIPHTLDFSQTGVLIDQAAA